MGNKGYYIRITEKDGLYYFQLWYRGKQEMGNSMGYKSVEECKKGLLQFKKILSTTNITENEKFVKIHQLNVRQYIYQFYDEKGDILYTSRSIEKKKNCQNSMESTCRNLVDADIK